MQCPAYSGQPQQPMVTMFKAFYQKLENKYGENFRSVIQGSIIAFAVKVLASGGAFILNIIIARQFGAEGTGIYYTVLSVATVAAVLGRYGVDVAAMRLVTQSVEDGDQRQVGRIFPKQHCSGPRCERQSCPRQR